MTRARLDGPLAGDPVDVLDPSRLDRECGWCGGPIRPRARRDALYCRTLCRQAAHRFGRQRAQRVGAGRPLRLAYADPPYPGTAARYYRDHPDYGGEVDHARLVGRLCHDYPDGWALSTSAAALRDVLGLCPPEAAVAAWVRGPRPVVHLRPLSAWEPVIYCGGRGYLTGPEPDRRRVDALVYAARARRSDPRRVVGAKPAAFAWWLFDLLGALPGDDLDDLFPGSHGIGRAWALYAAGPSPSTRATNPSGPPGTRDAPPGDHPRRLEAAG